MGGWCKLSVMHLWEGGREGGAYMWFSHFTHGATATVFYFPFFFRQGALLCVSVRLCASVCVCVFRCTLMLDTFMLIPGVSAPLAPRVMLACTTGPTCHARLHHWPHVSCLPAPLAPRVMLACTIGPTCHVCLQESSRAPTLLIVAEAGHHNPRPPRPRLCLPSDLI